MPLIEWSEEISVGVGMLDDEHKRMVEIMNDFYDSIIKEKGREILGEALDSLVAYETMHFKHEEDLFTETAYPSADAHKRNHQEAMQRILQLQSDFRKGASVRLCNDFLQFLTDWLTNHIMGVDKQYTAYLNAHDIY